MRLPVRERIPRFGVSLTHAVSHLFYVELGYANFSLDALLIIQLHQRVDLPRHQHSQLPRGH
jgi:hypothetical protein